MSNHSIKVITKNEEKSIQLAQGNTAKFQAEENTKYQIFNEQGELILNPKVEKINGNDLAVYPTDSTEPALILEDYYSLYPIEDSAYLSDISASLATSSSETPFVLASEVASVSLTSKIIYGLGALALIGGGIALVGGSGGSKSAATSASKAQPKGDDKKETPTNNDKPNVAVDPIEVTVSLETVTPDNILNLNESNSDVVVSGQFATDKPFTQANVWLEVGGKRFEATINQSQFSAKIPGSLLANHQQIKAIVNVENVESKGSAEGIQNYSVDTDIAAPTLVINKIATDDIINAVEARADTITITGYAVNGTSAEAKAGDKVVLQVGGLRVEGTLDAQLKFSIPVSTIALVNHKSVAATLVTSDSAENSATATANRSVEVDTGFNLSVSVDRIAIDDVVNRAESQNNITLSGTYTADSDVKNGSVVIKILVNGLEHQAVVNETNKTWTLSVSGQDLATEQGDHSITAKIQAQDKAGNENSATSNHQYRVDTVIDKPVVTITSIAGNDVIDAAESNGSIVIKGIVENAEGDGFVKIKCPCFTCSGGWKEVDAEVVNGTFEISVQVSDTSLASARLKSIERKVKANYTAEDEAGNTSAADEASRDYSLDLQREVNITKIGKGFDLSPTATTRIYGKIEEFGTLDNRSSDAYNQGMNARFIRSLKVNIGEKSYQVGFNAVEKTFFVDVLNSDLVALSGKNVSLDFNIPLSSNRAAPVSYYNGDARVNLLQTDANGTKRVIYDRGLIPTAKRFTLESDILVKNADNSYSVKAIEVEKSEISGVVNTNIAAGSEIDVKVGNQTFIARVAEDKTFKVEVDTKLLEDNAAKTVTATLRNDVTVKDVESYTTQGETSSVFNSPHSLVASGNRKINHTSDDYNFFHPIHLIEMNGGRNGFLNSYNPATTQAPKVIKYYFVKANDFAQLPSNTEGFDVTDPNTRVEVSASVKSLIQKAYAEVSKHTNLIFEEVSTWQEARAGEGSLIFGGLLTGYAAGAPALAFGGGNLLWNGAGRDDGSDYIFQVAIHEILHTLSLTHTDTNFNSTSIGKGLTFTGEDTLEFSNLSYFRPRLFMGMRDLRMYDMAYLHYRFGVNSEHRKGNDVYTFKTYDAMKSDGDIYIWDGSGIDTFDASAEKAGVTVNLTPGSWNYRGERKKNFVANGRKEYDVREFFGLDASEVVTNALDNRGTTYYGGDLQVSAGKVQFTDYIYDGQSFIGYGTQIENLIGSDYKDTLTGNNANNNIFGGKGNDEIFGGLGDDFINGGNGDDLMFGQDGNDTYVVDSVADVITEELNQGTDHVYSFIDYTLEENVENLTLVGLAATEGTGNALNNEIRGNDVGNTLNGMDGNDTLIGGLGADTLTGGNGNDIFVFESTLNGKADTITDFVVGEDKIKLSADIFSSLNAGLTNLNDHLFYDQATGELSYNSAATGINNSVHFATVTGLQSLEADRFILG